MATHKETLQDHEGRLKQIETQLGIEPLPPKKTIKERLTEWIKANPWASLALSIILAASTLFGAYWLNHHNEWRNGEVDARVGAVLEKPGGVQETLKQVRDTVNRTDEKLKTLEPFIQDVIKHQFENTSKLSTTAFQERLPAVQRLVAVAKDQEFKPDIHVLDAIANKLSAANTSAVGFWPTAAQLISYRSQNTVSASLNLTRPDLPNCTDHPPKPMELTVGGEDEKTWKVGERREVYNAPNPSGTMSTSALYQDCRFTLDSPEDTKRIPNLGEGKAYILTFRRCLIVYGGGQITLLTPNPRPTILTGKSPQRSDIYLLMGQTVRFDDCLLLFSINSKPPTEGQSLTEQLLAQRGSLLSVKVSKPATHS